MENLELMSMTDFVQMQSEKMYTKVKDRVGEPKYTVLQFITEIPNYANFLKQENAVWMFIPCDENGNALTEPVNIHGVDAAYNEAEIEQWKKAKENCFFLINDYQIDDDAVFFNNEEFIISRKTGHIHWRRSVFKTIEDIANDPDVKLYLSPRALKKIGV